MIIGTGTDLIDIRRIEKLMGDHEQRFAEKYFTSIERDRAGSRRKAGTHIDSYAKRFAAKEAMSKALGTGISAGVYMKDIGVVNAPSGQPMIELSGGALKRLEEITPAGHKAAIHLSLSDEPPLACAHVIIEACPLVST